MTFKYCKKCFYMRQFVSKGYDKYCDVCGDIE
jgi:hypothetical protein